MDVVVRSYMRLQAIGKICTAGAWIVLAIGIFLFSYIGFVFFPAANAATTDNSYVLQLLVVFCLLIIPTGGVSLLLFASSALIEYITIQDNPSQDDGDDSANSAQVAQGESAGLQLEIESIPNDERNALT